MTSSKFFTTATSAIAILLLTACNNSVSENEQTSIETTDSIEATKKPNILLLVGDDTAFGDIGAFGSEVKTPNMNELANVGVRFTNFHVSPVCSVTRSMIFTGNV
jgi:hypothetical protein